jgi:hypothetical protein
MRRITLILLLLSLSLPPASMQAQQKTGRSPKRSGRNSTPTTTQRQAYQLGTRSVFIPPPAGFADAFSQSDDIAKLLIATEVPTNEVLTAHLPVEELNKLKRGERPNLDYYTKVSVLKLAKTHDVSEAYFAGLVKQIEATTPQLLDINGPSMKSAVQTLRGGLSSVSGEEVQVDLEQPQNLGSFEKTKNVYSFMLLLTLNGPKGKLPVLGGISFVRVNQRVIFVYTYRKFTSEKDAEVLRDFSREWVRQILAANT